MRASGSSRPGCHSKSALLSKKRDVKPVGASSAARLRLNGPAPTPTASSVKSASISSSANPESTWRTVRCPTSGARHIGKAMREEKSSSPCASVRRVPALVTQLPLREPSVAARTVLRDVFGLPDFRPGQGEVVAAAESGADVLFVAPTGSGKSIAYWVPGIVADDLTIVVSPLIALMVDQGARLRSEEH